MARNLSHIVPHRRRREGRTDYRQRLRLLHSGQPRFVVRRQNSGLVCQFIAHLPTGDRTLATATAKHLLAAGWKGHPGNIPAAYLTGFLAGTRARKAKIASAIADFGLHQFTRGSALAAAVKGAVDAGVAIPHDEAALPSKDRLAGAHIAAYAAMKPASKHQFTKSAHANLEAHIAEVKAKLAKA